MLHPRDVAAFLSRAWWMRAVDDCMFGWCKMWSWGVQNKMPKQTLMPLGLWSCYGDTHCRFSCGGGSSMATLSCQSKPPPPFVLFVWTYAANGRV